MFSSTSSMFWLLRFDFGFVHFVAEGILSDLSVMLLFGVSCVVLIYLIHGVVLWRGDIFGMFLG